PKRDCRRIACRQFMVKATPMFEYQTRIATPKARQYLRQLCRHFSHKISVRWDDHSGRLTFDIGECRLVADADHLQYYCAAGTVEYLHEVIDVINRHFDHFALKDTYALVWSPL